MRRAIVIWDKVGGGLGLSKFVADNLGRYTRALLEIARSSGQRSERERLLKEDTAALLHRWAAYFDRRGIAWDYEPVRFDGWTPDFRLVMDGAQVYAQVKPVSEFPMDVAQRVLNAGCNADVLILGQDPRHAWRYRDGGWKSMDLTA